MKERTEANPPVAAKGTRRLHVFFSGMVQGVGFRYTARTVARRFAVSGWVRNTSDGRVELVAEGLPEELEAFLAAVGDDMSPYIRNVERKWEAATEEWSSFEISAAT